MQQEYQCQFRSVLRTDLIKIFEIEKRVFGEDKFDIMLLHDLVQHAIYFQVLEEVHSLEMIGFCIAMELDSQNNDLTLELHGLSKQYVKSAHIVNIAIDTPYQHRGFGKLLLYNCLDHLRQHRYFKVQLEVNTNNLKAMMLYKQAGFRQIEFLANYYQSGANAYRMELILVNN